jgi:hypothetical protein
VCLGYPGPAAAGFDINGCLIACQQKKPNIKLYRTLKCGLLAVISLEIAAFSGFSASSSAASIRHFASKKLREKIHEPLLTFISRV